MNTVIFNTENAVFNFAQKEVKERLEITIGNLNG